MNDSRQAVVHHAAPNGTPGNGSSLSRVGVMAELFPTGNLGRFLTRPAESKTRSDRYCRHLLASTQAY